LATQYASCPSPLHFNLCPPHKATSFTYNSTQILFIFIKIKNKLADTKNYLNFNVFKTISIFNDNIFFNLECFKIKISNVKSIWIMFLMSFMNKFCFEKFTVTSKCDKKIFTLGQQGCWMWSVFVWCGDKSIHKIITSTEESKYVWCMQTEKLKINLFFPSLCLWRCSNPSFFVLNVSF